MKMKVQEEEKQQHKAMQVEHEVEEKQPHEEKLVDQQEQQGSQQVHNTQNVVDKIKTYERRATIEANRSKTPKPTIAYLQKMPPTRVTKSQYFTQSRA